MRNRPSPRAWLVSSLLLSLPAGITACGAGNTSTTDTDPVVEAGGSAGSSGSGGSAGKAGSAGKPGQGGSSGAAGGLVGGSGGSGGSGAEAGAAGSAGGSGASGAAGSAGQAGICLPDEDGDQISDEVEGKSKNLDTDGDGTPDYKDTDSDNDSLPDLIEGHTKDNGCGSPQNSDKDAKPDFQDTDSDDNGLPDEKEIYPSGEKYVEGKPPADTDGDKYPDYADPDNDGDTVADKDELVDGKPVDTDGDGMPDLDDPDSDNDTIADGQDGTNDFDGDGKPNFRDEDSDNDGLPDKCEAGFNHKLGDPPVDSDNDGKYDFVDLDSDNDGLLDSEEDKNGNCEIDPGETDPRSADTDEDGVSDLIELALGSDPTVKIDTPGSHGKYYFVLPYNDTPQPETNVVGVKLALQKADVAFIMDTTGTMGQEIAGLKEGISSIASSLQQVLPDAQVGVGAHDDYPVSPYGDKAAGDQAFYVPAGGIITNDLTKTKQAINSLTTHNGGLDDTAESQVLAMWRALTNQIYQYPGNLVMPDTIPAGRFGALGFRKDALPILVPITDAAFHNGRRVTDPTTIHDPYSFNGTPPYPPPTVDTLLDAMDQAGARMIGISSSDGLRKGHDPYDDMAYIADQTNSLAPLKAFGGTCNTSVGGNPLPAPDGPNNTCRLIFDVPTTTGAGLSQRVIDGVKALLKSLVLDVRVVAIPDPPSDENGNIDSVDTFVQSIEVASGAVDPNNTAVACLVAAAGTKMVDLWSGPKGLAYAPDQKFETVKGADPDTKVCYKVTPIQNSTVMPTNKVQVFHAVLQVKAKTSKNAPEIDFGPPRDVLFVIPPLPQ